MKWLVDKVIKDPTDPEARKKAVGLLYNKKAKMSPEEVENWETVIKGGATVDATYGVHDAGNFDADFAKFDKDIKAVVVSADAYFRHHMEALIVAANKSKKYICYPLLSYRNHHGTTKPTAGNAVLIGPDLHETHPVNPDSAYYQMGVMAATVLRQHNPNPPIVRIVSRTVQL